MATRLEELKQTIQYKLDDFFTDPTHHRLGSLVSILALYLVDYDEAAGEFARELRDKDTVSEAQEWYDYDPYC